MKLIDCQNKIREIYPNAICKNDSRGRYGIYNGSNKRLPCWSCLSIRTAWFSCLNQLMKYYKPSPNHINNSEEFKGFM